MVTMDSNDWRKITEETPTLPGGIDEAIRTCLLHLRELEYPPYGLRSEPWSSSNAHVRGTMWIGVPTMKNYWRDKEGGWIISNEHNRTIDQSHYIRISPSPLEDEIQYGCCSIRMNKFPEKLLDRYPQGFNWRDINKVVITANYRGNSNLRVDYMVMATVSLYDPTDTSPAGREFKELTGKIIITRFIEDLLRKVYDNNPSCANILEERDERYKKMIGLILERAYPSFINPSPFKGGSLRRFAWLTGEEGHARWEGHNVWPYYYNVVIPQVLFDVLSSNMERGIPPLIPQYASKHTWMFNGSIGEACTGLDSMVTSRFSSLGLKTLAGVVGSFNTDLDVPTSYWPLDMNPPDRWLDNVIEKAEDLGKMELPLNLLSRVNVALEVSQKIPVMICRKTTKHFHVITAIDKEIDRTNKCKINSLQIEECNEIGKPLKDLPGENVGLPESSGPEDVEAPHLTGEET